MLPSLLSEPKMLAIEMKYEGYSYPEIRAALAERYAGEQPPALKTIQMWFYKNGELYDFYKAYAISENKLRAREARLTIKAHVKNAVRTLVQVMNKSKLDFARVQAAKELLARELGDPVKTVVNIDDPAEKLLVAMRILDSEVKAENEEELV